ncbi:unnamed protein product, partial [Didymodactylos carnosus]
KISVRRTQQTQEDTATSSVIFKVRRRQNNVDMNFLAQFLHALNVSNAPLSWNSIKRKISLNKQFKSVHYNLCSDCGEIVNKGLTSCTTCKYSQLIDFFYYPLVEQIQHLLLINNIYSDMIDTRVNNVKNLSCTQYGHILMAERADTSFTMLINADGVVTKNKNINLWPITFMVNEISLPRRRYTECVLLSGVIPASIHPSNAVMATCLSIINEDLIQLEDGLEYFIPEYGRRTLKSLIANMSGFNDAFGCGKCFTQGEVHHGTNTRGKRYNMRIFPYEQSERRNNSVCQ